MSLFFATDGMFWQSLNAGGTIESNVIFTPASALPRSAMFNLTVDMFGHSVNLLELGMRMDGIESYLLKLFGPNGYFPQNMVSDIIKSKLKKVSVILVSRNRLLES